MIDLHVNIDHVATIRQARGVTEPDPIAAAALAELAGANGITVHLREDRRHIQDRDVRILKETVQTSLNLEMAATKEMFEIACSIKPDIVTLVPEKRKELTTEGGLDVLHAPALMNLGVRQLKQAGIRVSLFIDTQTEQIKAAQNIEADDVEFHTGPYANAKHGSAQQEAELHRLIDAANYAHRCGLNVNAGHGLNYQNTAMVCHLPHLRELNIGHSIVSRSVLTGMHDAVSSMLSLMQKSTH